MGRRETQRFVRCFLCTRRFQYGPRVYAGRLIKPWHIVVCLPCIGKNSGGLSPNHYPRLMEHFRAARINFQSNIEGSLAIPPRGALGSMPLGQPLHRRDGYQYSIVTRPMIFVRFLVSRGPRRIYRYFERRKTLR